MKDIFIKEYKVFDKDFCEDVIQTFESCLDMGIRVRRRNDQGRKDNQLEMNSFMEKGSRDLSQMDLRNTELSTIFFEKLAECGADYVEELGLKNIISSTYFKNMLVQRYEADQFESYSSWHCEAGTLNHSDRAMVYMLYLNDNFEGGETEFMYQKHREIPEQGKLIIWPAGYTHTHRGSMITKGIKYIATGWIFFLEQ